MSDRGLRRATNHFRCIKGPGTHTISELGMIFPPSLVYQKTINLKALCNTGADDHSAAQDPESRNRYMSLVNSRNWAIGFEKPIEQEASFQTTTVGQPSAAHETPGNYCVGQPTFK